MKKYIFTFLTALLMISTVNAQETVDLWPDSPPTSNEITTPEGVENNGSWITNVSHPMLMIYSPDKETDTGIAVVICPGGGYAGLAFQHEGKQFAEWLNTLGITGIILKYRMPNKHKNIPLEDVWQAMRYVRENAERLKIDRNKIGIAGFSAGGHLASTASTHYSFEGASTRPDFSILFYPVVTMTSFTHGGSRENLLGKNPTEVDIQLFSNEKQVNNNTPPTILLLSDDDKVVDPLNSIHYYEALKKNDIPASLYIFPEGGHGWGMNTNFKYHETMLSLLEEWLKGI